MGNGELTSLPFSPGCCRSLENITDRSMTTFHAYLKRRVQPQLIVLLLFCVRPINDIRIEHQQRGVGVNRRFVVELTRDR